MGMKSKLLSFSPALLCADCQRPATQGFIYPMSPQVWQLLPFCDEHSEELPGSDEPVAISALRSCINNQLATIQHLQRSRRYFARAYLHLRRQHAHHKAQRALRIGLNRASRRQAQMREEVLL